MPTNVNDKLISWASEIDPETIRQAEKTARLPIVEGHVALMPDAHVGIGATVGSVIPTKNAVIPSAVGVDIGCGMIAAELDLTEAQLPDNLEPLLGRIEKAIPAGVGQGHDRVARNADMCVGHQGDVALDDREPSRLLRLADGLLVDLARPGDELVVDVRGHGHPLSGCRCVCVSVVEGT